MLVYSHSFETREANFPLKGSYPRDYNLSGLQATLVLTILNLSKGGLIFLPGFQHLKHFSAGKKTDKLLFYATSNDHPEKAPSHPWSKAFPSIF